MKRLGKSPKRLLLITIMINTNALKQTKVTIDQTYSKDVHWPAASS